MNLEQPIIVLYNSISEAQEIEKILVNLGHSNIMGTNRLTDVIKYTKQHTAKLVVLNLVTGKKNTFKIFENHASRNNIYTLYHTTDETKKIINEENSSNKLRTKVVAHKWGDYKFNVAVNQLLQLKAKYPLSNYVILKNDSGSFEKVFEDQILYIKSFNSRLFIHTPWYVYQKLVSLSKFSKNLSSNFLRINDNLLVNKKYKHEYPKPYIKV